MTRSKFEMEALDANLWTDEDFGFPEEGGELVREPESPDTWWYDEK